MAPVADKYGWSPDGLIGPEMGLVAASLPFAVATFAAVKAKRAEGAAKAPAAPPVETAPGNVAGFGANAA